MNTLYAELVKQIMLTFIASNGAVDVNECFNVADQYIAQLVNCAHDDIDDADGTDNDLEPDDLDLKGII